MTSQRFSARLTESGTRTYVVLPFDPDNAWGVKERHYITGTVNGCRVRGVLGSNGREYFLPLGPAWLKGAGLAAGATVDVELSPEGPQGGNVAPDVAKALGADPRAKAFFEGLATFYRKNFIRWIESAKRPETRAARISEMMKLLKAGRREK
jgi:hypothetical protein